jgi:DNA-binding IclR family transcriptional regulator
VLTSAASQSKIATVDSLTMDPAARTAPGAPEAPPEGAAVANGRRYADLQGVGRAFAILEQVAERPMRASELARALGIKWTTAHRTLTYLTAMGYLERDDSTTRFHIGVRAYALGSAYVATLPLSEAARPYLHAAAIVSRSTAQLVKRDERRSVVIGVCDSGREHVPETTIGCNFPLHCGSKGLVLLAFATPGVVDTYLSRQLERLTDHSEVEPDRVRARLDRIRAQGYAVTDRDVRLFSSSVAAPVRDRTGEVVAAVTLVVPPADLAERREQLVQVVLRTAQGISQVASGR